LSEATLLLLGAEAEAQAPRLEASGYSCLIGEASAAHWPRCHLAVLAADQQGRIPELQQRLPGIPLLLDIGSDSVGARSRLLQVGASDFWLSSQGPSDLLLRLRLHLKLIHKDQPSRDRLSLADLTVVPHPEAGEDVSSSDALHAVLFDSARPVMVAPLVAPERIGTRVCIAWNGTAESAASVQAALPWMQKAEAVRVLTADEYHRRGPAAADLLGYLALHGITADTAVFRPIDREVGAGLLRAAKDFQCDLLSMGAYSHSRLRQLILGGVTRHVLEHADLPVMMTR